ncbi:MAG: hypothetical protein ABIS47_09240 [Acidimicrobiales bacterium]
MDAVARINQLLESSDGETVGTSMRIPTVLREAAEVAVSELGAATSTTGLTTEALRIRLEAIVAEAALAGHYARHPHVRPSLAELALAAAELDGSPLAKQPDLIRHAAAAILDRHPDADADAALLWAEALASRVA